MVDHGVTIDGFLSDFDAVRAFADQAEYEDLPASDGVTYPGICVELPDWLLDEVLRFMFGWLGRKPEKPLIFMRASPEGVMAPHQAHSDERMGRWSLMVYLNRAEHCQGGTALVRHRDTGMAESDPSLADVWARDTNDPAAWEVTYMAEMAPNRAFVFPAPMMHRAEPVGGFGSTREDMRLVLTGFFS